MTNEQKIVKDYNLFFDKVSQECWGTDKEYEMDSYVICVDSANQSRDRAIQNDTSFYFEFFQILKTNLEKASFYKSEKIVSDAKNIAEVSCKKLLKE